MTDEEINDLAIRIAFDELGDEVPLNQVSERAQEIKAEMLFFGLDAETLIKRRRRWEEDDDRKHSDATVRWVILVLGVLCLVGLALILAAPGIQR